MLDAAGYRLGVGIVILNNNNNLLLAKRCIGDNWQFPQGGIKYRETITAAMYRELHEEVGLRKHQVSLLTSSKYWQEYQFPKDLLAKFSNDNNSCIGQRHRWFLLRLLVDDTNINLQATNNPEFSAWSWVDWQEPLKRVVEFKHKVYKTVLAEFFSFLYE